MKTGEEEWVMGAKDVYEQLGEELKRKGCSSSAWSAAEYLYRRIQELEDMLAKILELAQSQQKFVLSPEAVEDSNAGISTTNPDVSGFGATGEDIWDEDKNGESECK